MLASCSLLYGTMPLELDMLVIVPKVNLIIIIIINIWWIQYSCMESVVQLVLVFSSG